MLKTTSKIALALLLAASPSALLAQSTQQPQAPATEQSAPDAMTPESTTGDTAATTPEGEGAIQKPAKPIDGQIVLQDSSSKLANDLLGAAVYSPDGETIGKINDLIIDQNGAVEGVVLGVGGFLGIGEKAVAVERAKLTLTLTPDGQEGLLLNATKADLEAAPAFKTIEQQRAEAEAAEAEEATRLKEQEGVMDDSVPPAGTAQPQ